MEDPNFAVLDVEVDNEGCRGWLMKVPDVVGSHWKQAKKGTVLATIKKEKGKRMISIPLSQFTNVPSDDFQCELTERPLERRKLFIRKPDDTVSWEASPTSKLA
jgi:hypothetical protein